MELIILGMLLGAGAAKRKSVTKALAKGYMAVAETSHHLREDMRGAIEEAKSEQEREQSEFVTPEIDSSAEYLALQEEAASGTVGASPTLTAHKSAPPTSDSVLLLETSEEATAKPKPSRNILKSFAKGCLSVVDMTRSAAVHVREDLRDAVEEARYEREQAASLRAKAHLHIETSIAEDEPTQESAHAPVDEPEIVVVAPVEQTLQTRKPRAAKSEPVASVPATPKRRGRPPNVKKAVEETLSAPPKSRRTKTPPKEADAPPVVAETVSPPKSRRTKAAPKETDAQAAAEVTSPETPAQETVASSPA